MDIKLNKDEIKTLLGMIHMAESVIFDSEPDEEDGDSPEIEPYVLLIQKLLKQAHEAGHTKEVIFDTLEENYFLTDEFVYTDAAETIFAAHRDEVFWAELVNRLSAHEMLRKFGKIALSDMTHEELIDKKMEVMDALETEFSENDIENLIIKK